MPHETSGGGMERAMPLNLQSGNKCEIKSVHRGSTLLIGIWKQWSKLIDAGGNQYHAIALDNLWLRQE
jgi:hypothetical protein